MPFSMPDRIDTERTVLRHPTVDDLDDIHVYFGDEEATRYTTGKALTEAETWRAILTIIGHWHVRNYGPYAVERKIDHRVVGICGLWYPVDWPEPEIKWALARPYWRQGYASEATRGVQRAASRHLPDLSLISFINSRNDHSIRLAGAVGARLEETVTFRNEPWQIHRHPRITT